MSIEEIKLNINQYVEEKKEELNKKEIEKRKKKEDKKHIISILFTTYTDWASRVVALTSGFGYTHVSIGLDDKKEYFYAFNTKGFRKEYPKKHKNKTSNNICYFLEVTHRQYKKLSKLIRKFERNNKKKKYKYNWLGLFSCMVRIPIKFENRYFCSQFVAKLLEWSDIIKFKKSTSRYLPNQLNNEIRSCPFIINKIENCFAV